VKRTMEEATTIEYKKRKEETKKKKKKRDVKMKGRVMRKRKDAGCISPK
jgi:hypothetical protein